MIYFSSIIFQVQRKQEDMPKYTLHYFNLRGRGQLSRLIFHYAGVEFTDHTFDFEQWFQVEKKNSKSTVNSFY